MVPATRRASLFSIPFLSQQWSPTGNARHTSMFFGGHRRSISSYARGFGELSSSYSATAIVWGLLRRRIKGQVLIYQETPHSYHTPDSLIRNSCTYSRILSAFFIPSFQYHHKLLNLWRFTLT